MKTIILTILLLSPIAALAQEPIIHTIAPRVYRAAIVDGKLAYILGTVSLEPIYFTTKREQDSIRIIDLRELLAEDHIWLSRHVWRNDSTDGIYRHNRVARNEAKLHEADSAFTLHYSIRYTVR